MRRDALCGAHLLRELRAAFENESQGWAKEMFDLLSEMNKTRNATPDGVLPRERIDFFKERYRAVLASGEAELPPPEPRKEGARGRTKKSKAAISRRPNGRFSRFSGRCVPDSYI